MSDQSMKSNTTVPAVPMGSRAAAGSRRQAEKHSRTHSNPVDRWAIGIGIFIVGFLAYWFSDLILTRYIGKGASWLIVGLMAIVALVVWIVDERRLNQEHGEDAPRGDE